MKYLKIILSVLLLNLSNGLFAETFSSESYTLQAPLSSQEVQLVDATGQPIHHWSSEFFPALSTYLLDNGELLRTGKDPDRAAIFSSAFGAGGIIEILDTQSNRVWSHSISTDNRLSHHDVAILPNGNVLAAVWEVKSASEAQALGRSDLNSDSLWGDAIYEICRSSDTNPCKNGSIVWSWSAWDHLIQNQDIGINATYVADISAHADKINLNYSNPDNSANWLEVGSLDYDAERDLILLSVKSFNEVWIIDHGDSTKGILARIGNPAAHGEAGDQRLFSPGYASWIGYGKPGAGNILVYNAGINRPGGDYPSIDEYCYAGECIAGELVSSYLSETTEFFSSESLVNAQRLKNGNTLVTENTSGISYEYDENQQIVDESQQSDTGLGIRYAKSYAGLENVIRATTTDLCADTTAPTLSSITVVSDETATCSVTGVITLSSNVVCNNGGTLILKGSSVIVQSDGLTAVSGCNLTMSTQTTTTTTVDITNTILTNGSNACADYANNYTSSVNDVNRSIAFNGSLSISTDGSTCTFSGNAIPNHDFNDGTKSFVTDVSEQTQEYQVTTDPQPLASVTALTLSFDNAVYLNGVKLDLLAAGCYGVDNEKTGCFDIDQPFRFDPMSSLVNFGTDQHNAHAQSSGTYHYHGSPEALFTNDTSVESPVIGFAADGFPIFGSYINDNGTIRKVTSSYSLKSGSRISVIFSGTTYDPGGTYDGTYRDDHEYTSGSGDLDECNGMTRNSVYGYYVTDTYPWVMGCFKGTPHSSFSKM